MDSSTEWAGQHFNPESVKFGNPRGQAAWDTLALGMVWGPAQGVVTKFGYWHEKNGWASNNEQYLENLKMTWTDTALDAGELFGVRNEDGWLYDPRSDNPSENLSWGWWWDNAKNSGEEIREGHAAWSKRESDPEYQQTYTAINTITLVGGPFKLGLDVLNLGNGRSGGGTGTESGSESGPFGGQGTGPGTGGSDREIADIVADGRIPIAERFDDIVKDMDFGFAGQGGGPTGSPPPVTPSPPSTPNSPVPPPGATNPNTSLPSSPDATTPTPAASPPSTPTPNTSTPSPDAGRGPSQTGESGSSQNRGSDPQASRGDGADRRPQGESTNPPVTGGGNEVAGDRSGTGTGDRVEGGRGQEPTRPRGEEQPPERLRGRRDDEQTVPPRTGDTRADDATSTRPNNTNNETTEDRGNTSQDSTSNSNQQNSGVGGTNGGGSSGNGGGDGGSPGDPTAGGTGDGNRPPGPKTLAQFEKHRWGDKDDPAAQEAFRRDVEYLVNNDEAFRSKYYNAANSRVREDLKIGLEQWQLPKLHADKETSWLTPLKEPTKPDFIGDKTSVRFNRPDFLKGPDGKPLVGAELARREKLREEFSGLDDLAVDRREKIDRAGELDKAFKEAEAEHGKYKEKGPNHPELEKAQKDKANAYRESTEASETFGEKSANVAARYEFDGGPLLDKSGNPVMRDVLDDSGNKIGEQAVVKPNLEGARLLGQASGAPGNGNGQFDLIYETAQGEIVIIEAKSSTQTSLGTRVHKPNDGIAVDTMQGTGNYVDSILRAMRGRGNDSEFSADDGSKIPGAKRGPAGEDASVGERALADYIDRKKRQGKLTYALFKGDPRPTNGMESANGYDYQIFDIG